MFIPKLTTADDDAYLAFTMPALLRAGRPARLKDMTKGKPQVMALTGWSVGLAGELVALFGLRHQTAGLAVAIAALIILVLALATNLAALYVGGGSGPRGLEAPRTADPRTERYSTCAGGSDPASRPYPRRVIPVTTHARPRALQYKATRTRTNACCSAAFRVLARTAAARPNCTK